MTRLWARRGTRPRAPRDRRYSWADIFGAVCPARGVGAGLVLPFANTEAMQHHLDQIGCAVAPGAHAVVVLDGAGWHGAIELLPPDNVSLLPLPLPPYSPELNPAENIWQYLRQNDLSMRVWRTYDDIVETCCEAWNKLIAQPQRIKSIATRQWAVIA